MSWSLGEIRALSIKAARGAGFEWGLAEEAGYSVAWLQRNNASGVQALSEYLERISDQKNHAHNTCPIRLGAAISDNVNWHGFLPATINQPLLLVPFIAGIITDETIEIQFEGSTINFSADALNLGNFTKPISETPTKCDARIVEGKAPQNQIISRVSDTELPYVRNLEKFAHKTYAPATEESRISGAGAGLSDND